MKILLIILSAWLTRET